MTHSISTSLMFIGQAQAALDLYSSVFQDAETGNIERYGSGDGDLDGQIKRAYLTLRGQSFILSDSPNVHEFTFTPSMSIFVECASNDDLEDKFKRLSQDGKILMPPDNYGFSKRFTWVEDRFGVSWQLNLD